MSDYNLLIDTPENLTLEAEVAGFGSRCMAALLDYFIIFIVWYLASLIFFRAADNSSATQESVLYAVYIILSFAIVFFYHLGFELIWNGQTPGKRFFGMRIVQANGMPASVTSIVLRNLVRIFDFFPGFYGVGLVVMFGSKHSQRLGDMAARTLAVYERGQITLSAVQEGEAVRFRYAAPNIELPSFVNIDVLDEQDRHLITQFLNRRNEMISGYSVAMLLAYQLIQKMDVKEDVSFVYRANNAEKLLELIARAFERRERERQQQAQV